MTSLGAASHLLIAHDVQVFMKVWARRVLTADYTNGKTWAYMDKVGIMHTGHSPFK